MAPRRTGCSGYTQQTAPVTIPDKLYREMVKKRLRGAELRFSMGLFLSMAATRPSKAFSA
jgi:hypothetical protein